MQDDPTTDVGWLAFQYVNDEMTASQAAAFEQRLADDQQAREAVADAVLLTEALSACPLALAPVPAVMPSRASGRYWLTAGAWAACGAAVCLAAVLGPRFWPVGQGFAPLVRTSPLLSDEELALTWANSQFAMLSQDILSPDVEPDALTSGEEDLGLAGSESARSSSDLEQNVSVPSWLLEAVHGAPSTDLPPGQPEEI